MTFLSFGSLNGIPAKQSASSANLPEVSKKITGIWKAVSSSGGYTGKGFTLDFDYLTLKDNGTFELMQKDSLIAYGKVALSNDKKMVICNFIFDKTANVQLAIDPEKYIQITNADTLNLIAPCCDRYNIKLARVK
jgi:hypothetical protein